jgi:hypothetical protein
MFTLFSVGFFLFLRRSECGTTPVRTLAAVAPARFEREGGRGGGREGSISFSLSLSLSLSLALALALSLSLARAHAARSLALLNSLESISKLELLPENRDRRGASGGNTGREGGGQHGEGGGGAQRRSVSDAAG